MNCNRARPPSRWLLLVPAGAVWAPSKVYRLHGGVGGLEGNDKSNRRPGVLNAQALQCKGYTFLKKKISLLIFLFSSFRR